MGLFDNVFDFDGDGKASLLETTLGLEMLESMENEEKERLRDDMLNSDDLDDEDEDEEDEDDLV